MVTLAEQAKDWATAIGIIAGGCWAIWKFGYSDWLRRRSEAPSLEGGVVEPQCCLLDSGSIAVSLRWTWKNVGPRPVYLDTYKSFVEIYEVPTGQKFIDPRQQEEELKNALVGTHHPLMGLGFFQLEPGTTSSILTVPVLVANKSYIARLMVATSVDAHPTPGGWSYTWERWQVFRTDVS